VVFRKKMTGCTADGPTSPVKGEIKQDVKKEINDCGDIFASEESNESNLLIAPAELIKQENELEEKLEKAAEKEEKDEISNLPSEIRELTESERYEKLCNLLKKSKFYSNYLLSKMEKEDEESKKLKEKQLSNRKKRSAGVELKNDTRKSKRPKKYHGRTYEGQDVPDDQPLLLKGGVMRDYQIKGYLWMSTLFENGINGILADEMGLGKTIQTIALFCHLVEMGVSGPFLIVAPLSTIENWKREFNRFAPSLPVVLYHGTKEERAEIRRQHLSKSHNLTDFGDAGGGRKVRNAFVTSFNIAMNDTAFLAKVKWMYVVVDEGHRLKNMNCKLIRSLKLYDCANKLLLTGTPLQNNLDELWSLLNFIMGEIFDDLRVFKSWFSATDMHTNKDEADRILKQEQQNNILSTLHQILTPFLLRRVKADVDLRIPPKKEVLVYCPMTEEQREYYQTDIQSIKALVNKGTEREAEEQAEAAEEKGRGKRKKANIDYAAFFGEGEENNGEISEDEFLRQVEKVQQMREQMSYGGSTAGLTAYGSSGADRTAEVRMCLKNHMMDLRKTTNHPYLIKYPLTEDGVFYKSDEAMVDICGKLKVLDQMLKELMKRGHKVLLFSQMTRMLDILGDYLNHRGLRFARLDGAMSFVDRQDNIDTFSSDPDVNVFLLSTRAGGLGINLTAADTVIIYDSDWNPQQDLQAQDRAHRIGQTKPVMIYRLVTANTLDEKIVERAAAKRRLEKLIIHRQKFKSQDLSGLKTTMQAITPQELIELLNSKDHAGVIDRKDGPIFSQEDLNALLDRSELAWNRPPAVPAAPGKAGTPLKEKSSNKKGEMENAPPPPVIRKTSSSSSSKAKSSVFKVVDTEGIPNGLPSVSAAAGGEENC